MNILFISDDVYARHLVVTIKSILNNNGKDISFYIFDLGISEESKKDICDVVIASGNKVYFIFVNESDFNQFPSNIDYISLATYARLKATDYLPSSLNKIIYLDVDVLVFDSLETLWNIDISHYFAAACYDSFIENENHEHKKVISMSEREYYFNAGVMVFNLEEWRKIDVFSRSLELLDIYPNQMIYQDQDILNILFKNKIYYLDCRFNFMPNQLERIKQYHKGKLSNLHSLEKTTMPVAISHYCGPEKAWHDNCKHFKVYFYQKILAEITKGTDKKRMLSIKNYLKALIRRIRYKFKYQVY
ncbi:General stress protein A [Pasteurella multocida]|uniref:glycosyltransferase family 8 protein n=1 Tax=Pasteurella multocida TaxID=747 RepID=UPI000743936F|nr:glycosyltransferase family 8 protein [Pasteurella multocida]KUM14489.1 glycosyl transferase family 8 [Pasteurella multocida]MCL7758918.1 glycosyltransferase family 8 protein [Pasteurella multocida]MCL7821053.1 glycosyltransferase family 8 protein [Pasteurella multocida]MEB3469370.1 glycosyltransferase family 8 protein [Pasteurella multocida]NNH92213.1 glycosyltransferase family 8 protein [Pasteurella multocida]